MPKRFFILSTRNQPSSRTGSVPVLTSVTFSLPLSAPAGLIRAARILTGPATIGAAAAPGAAAGTGSVTGAAPAGPR
ncbi:hypothetical protein D3C87_2075230 [compost metagenome]